jgi:hypothetical protein
MRALRHAVRAISRNLEGASKDRTRIRHLQRFGEAQQGWWQDENVVGVCVAKRRRGGKLGALCVQVLVRRKVALHKLKASRRIPAELTSPAFARPLRTDVRPVGDVRLESLVSVERPAHPGFDIGNMLGGSGTLGCVVVDGQGRRLGLSCAHVLAPDGTDDLGSPSGSVALCPSLPNAQALDVVAQAPIGKLVNVLVPCFDPGDAATNLDAAVFLPDDPKALSAAIADIGVSPKGISDGVTVGLKVHKVGAVSAETHGVVQSVGLTIKIPYGDDMATFVEQIGISSFTQPGDSGALVLDEQNRAIGMHLGSAEGMSICTPIRRVLDALHCQLA